MHRLYVRQTVVWTDEPGMLMIDLYGGTGEVGTFVLSKKVTAELIEQLRIESAK